jgi:uncharacterized protein (DUF305 family)
MLRHVNTSAHSKWLEEAVPGSPPRRIDTFVRYAETRRVIPRHAVPALALTLCLTGCAGGTATGAPSPAPPAVSSAPAFGGTDRAWVEINIAMAEELLPLLDLAPTRSRDARVKELSAQVKALHERELAALYQLHDAAGLPAENPHKGMPMPGMVTPEQVAAAAAASGPTFDRLLREHLAEHVAQGLRLATSEQKSGVEPRTRALAAQMIADRTELSDRIGGSGT